jgi:mercuric ion binding protein
MMRSAFLAWLALGAALGLPATAAAAEKTVVLSVPGMTCEACPITVRKALERVPGVIKVKATLEPKEATVTFDDARVSVEALLEATRRVGFAAQVKSP